MTETAYKVVLVTGNGVRRTSVTYESLPTEWILIYPPGERVTPQNPGSKIFVFRKLEAATTFASCYSNCNKRFYIPEIWECKCENLTDGDLCVNLWLPKAQSLLHSFWHVETFPLQSCFHTPHSTALADAITLTKRVDFSNRAIVARLMARLEGEDPK